MSSPKVFRLLLVEDDSTDRKLVQQMLSQQDGLHFDISVAESLSEGIRELEQATFDGVLLDLTLPDSRQLEACDRLAELFPDVPFVVLTGLSDRDLAVMALQHGAQDYLCKSNIDGERIARTLEYAAERKRTSQALRNSELRYRALVGAMTSMLWEADANGAFIGKNPEWLKYTTQSESLADGEGWLYVFHAEDAARIEREWKTARAAAVGFEASGRLWNAPT